MNKGRLRVLFLMVLCMGANAYAQDDIDMLRTELANESKELREMVSSFTDRLDSVKAPFRNEIAKAEADVQLKEKEIRELKSQLKGLKNTINEKDTVLARMTDTLARCEASLANVREELSTSGKNIQDLSKQKSAIADKELKARLEIEQLQKELDLKEARKQNDINVIKTQADNEKIQLGNQIRKLSRELAIFQEKTNENLNLRVALKKDIELANARYNESNKQINIKDTELKKADKTIASLETTIDKLKEANLQQKEVIISKEQAIKKYEANINDKEIVLNKNLQMISDLESRVAKLNKTIEEKNNLLNARQKEKEELVNYFKGELDNRKKQIMQLLKQTK